MRIACLQFAPQVGDVDNNLNRADAILSRVDPEALDLLVLPELAFSGYNFKSLSEISPFLEPSGSGISSLWTRTMALKYDCTVITGYPEKVDPTLKWPTNPEYYNAAIIVNGEGETVANYRKTHLYYTDETWALEGPAGFFGQTLHGLGRTAIGICMDLNPYKFEAPWDEFEFAHHVLDCGSRLVVVSMAWITNDDPRQFSRMPQEPDMSTLLYWVSRFEPIIRAESCEEVIVVFANRTGSEGQVTYAGTSAVIGIQSGEVRVYGILGRGDKDLLVVDTSVAPYAKLVYRPGENGLDVEAGEPGGYDQRQDYENRGPQRSPGARESEGSPPTPSSHQTPQGDSDAIQEKNMSARHSENKSLDQHHSGAPVGYATEGQHIRTHTAPSPGRTPNSAPPRLMVSTRHSNSHGYLNAPSPASLYAANASGGPFQVLGGEVSFHGPNVDAGSSPLAAYESQLSGTSCESPRDYWAPTQFSLAQLPGSRWAFLGDADDQIISEDSPVANQENRYSIRSDVSVWNNQPGRPPSIANDMMNHPTPPRELSLGRVGRDAPERTPSLNDHLDVARHKSLPIRTYSVEPPLRSRPRGHERSKPATVDNDDLGAVCQRPEGMAMSANASQQHTLSLNGDRDRFHLNSAHRTSGSRGHSRGEKPTPMLQDDGSHEESTMTASIPIALGQHPTRSGGSRESSNTGGQLGSTPRPPPRQASSGHAVQRTSSQGRIGDNPPPRSAFTQRELRSNTPAKPVDRGTSRGRRREGRPATNQEAATPGIHQRRNSTNTSRGHHAEPVDLSHFTLIEDYTAPNCPVHGFRSRSRTGPSQVQPGNNTSPGTDPACSPPQPERVERRRKQNTPRPASRKDAPKVATRSSRPHASPQLSSKHAETPKTSTPTATRSKQRHQPLVLSARQRPKTPEAMILASDGKTDALELLATMKCIERSLGKSTDRPRSAVW
ncbi:protein amidase [Metarhizium album ARSEF 1941]|uniref:Protein amidase n=1 Tax=Metarhizium album (strain ARSEF 1941) TaxID=1081103 RepID=A0A0B2WP41_METAS|nr:protein amidase [Metarhizium album ARSEF 1941]KHN95768.1 protein amidase [Metarhizium album ARSEF 1941]